MIRVGTNGHFQWLSTEASIPSLHHVIVALHRGLRLAITAFDSGPLQPTPEEQRGGWSVHGDVMLSPPLQPGLEIPSAECDEWYLFEQEPPPQWKPKLFVNYLGFTVVPINELRRDLDPTWDRNGLDWLEPLQAQFWSEMEMINPVTYVAVACPLVVVSRIPAVVDAITTAAERGSER
jgi:hypothetical protein